MLGQVKLGYVRFVQVSEVTSTYVRLNQFRSGKFSLVQVC
jgi:hypothetical protein